PLDLGDPITTLGTMELGFYEHVDAAVIDEEWAILVGQGGFTIASLDDGHIDDQYSTDRGYYIGLHDHVAWVGTKYNGLYEVDLTDPTDPRMGRRYPGLADGAHMDVDFDGTWILVSWLADGAELVRADDLTRAGSFDVTSARGAALGDGIALICDETDEGSSLVLFDISDPAAPAEVDRAALPGRCHDVAIEGDKVVAAMGGYGIEVLRLDGDSLVDRGQVTLPGTTLGVDIDGDHAWTGSWEVAGLVWIGDESTPVVIGHEEVSESAMGVGAGHGKAMVADWFHATAMQLDPDVAGPELVIPDELPLADGQTDPERLELWNNGAFDLDLTLTVTGGELGVSEESLVLAPGEKRTVLVDPGTRNTGGTISWTSNDPDEPAGNLNVSVAVTQVGEPHVDFELPGFSWPDGELTNSRLSDFEGEVVFLAYWAEY
ncbi:MAG: hypothetical protein D6798_10675, partial [Deltaproteobacteria bacterium]